MANSVYMQQTIPLDDETIQDEQVDTPGASARPERIGASSITYHDAAGILTPASGFMADYDYTLNPYTGCSFGCSYCYAAFFVRDTALQNSWGEWIKVKENALYLLQKRRKRPLDGQTIYMSSVTDPYQPIERQLGITRALLQELATYHRPRLVIQTRSPIATRDIDLFQQFEHIQVNMTITTDDDTVRRVFEPTCSAIQLRLRAIAEITASGVPTCITMTPLLPLRDPHSFATTLLATGVNRFVVQPFHTEKGRFVAGTRDKAMRLFAERQWDRAAYQSAYTVLQQAIPQLSEGKQGFAPV